MIVTLSDFGNSEYLGAMKGVIKTIQHKAEIIDLCNTISPQNVVEGAWVLHQNYKLFPRGTIFLCVVDPGVGSDRKPIIIETENYYFIGPDNGLMYPSAKEDNILRMVHVKYVDKKKIKVSNTFHGRDIFARIAAKMDEKMFLDDFGDYIKKIKPLKFKLSNRKGQIVRIDHFGNIVTNLRKLKKIKYEVEINKKKHTMTLYRSYSEAPDGKLFLIVGSSDTLEISLKGESAIHKFPVCSGDTISIT